MAIHSTNMIPREQITERYDSLTGGDKDNEDVNLFWRVICDEDTTPEEVLQDSGLPRKGEAYPLSDRPFHYCIGRSVDRERDTREAWIVRVTYQDISMEDGSTTPERPWDLPVRIETADLDMGQAALEQAYRGQHPDSEEGVLEKGTFGNPEVNVVNSARMPFDPPVPFEETCVQYRITENRRNWDMNTVFNFRRTVNSNAFRLAGRSIAPWQGFMAGISASTEYWSVPGTRARIPYYRLSFTIRVITDRTWGWQIKVANRGTAIINEAGTGWKRDTGTGAFVDQNDKPITEPMWLSKNGKSTLGPHQRNSYNYFLYLPYYPRNWSTLRLPRSQP